ESTHPVRVLDGEPLTCERRKRAIGEVFTEHEMTADEFIVSHGPQSAVGHEMGFGPIAPGEPLVVDLWPRDRKTACHADMTRTFVVGEPPAELVEYHRLVLEAPQQAHAALKAGVGRGDPYDPASQFPAAHGQPTGA